MTSEIHTLSPQTAVTLISENLIYSKSDFHFDDFVNYGQSQGFSKYAVASEGYEYVTHGNQEMLKVTYNSPRCKVVHYNNLVGRSFQRGRQKRRDAKGADEDENCTSRCSKDTTDDNKWQSSGGKAGNDQTESCSKPMYPNLYQPNVTNQNNKYSLCGNHRGKFPHNTEVTERIAHGLMQRFISRAYKLRIYTNSDLLNGGPWDQLNQAVWDVSSSKIQHKHTYIDKLNFWKSVFIFLRMSLSSSGLFVVGSTMSGFALEGSDIDFCLLTKPFSNEPRVDSLHHLNNLKHSLLKNGLASEAELIMAKVPILKFKNKEFGFEADLNCNNVVSIHNTRLLFCYAQMDWRVRPLVVVVKIWAQANNINDAKNMTISSYSWALMVIHYLQCGVSPPVLPCLHEMFPEKFNCTDSQINDVQENIEAIKQYKSENMRCLGDLLIGFFHYYSYFNYSNYAISVRTGARLPIEICKQAKTPKNEAHQWKYLCIEEPFDYSNTARSVFDLEVFKHIRQVIMYSYKELACNKTLSHIIPLTLQR